MSVATIFRVLGVVVLVLIVVLLFLWAFQRKLVYQPDTSRPPSAADVLPGAEDVTLTTSDGVELGAWYVPALGSPRDIAVLVANGNGGNRAGRAPLAAALRSDGFDVLLFDYRGYGGNPGSPTEHGLARDAFAARGHLVDERGIPPDRLVYFGESLGSAVVTDLAVHFPPGALLLRSPFTDLAAAARAQFPMIPASMLLWDEFQIADTVDQVEVPTAVVYGSADSIVPPSQSRDVAEAASADSVVSIEGAGHNDDVMFNGRQIVDTVVDLSESIGRQ